VNIGQLKEYVRRQAAAGHFSGAIVVARERNVLYSRAYGLASKAFGVPNRIDTHFNIGSMNKMVTGVAIAQLVEAGQLRYSDFVGTQLPDYPRQDVASSVTIHHLLTHTSGLGTYFNDRFEASRDQVRSVGDYLGLFAKDPPQFSPGERAEYSNAGYIVLGAIIERVSGQGYDEYVREHIYAPSGMRETEAYALDQDVANLAIGYTHMDPDGQPQPERWWNNLLSLPARGGPAGGGYSTVNDLLQFTQALREHRLLSPAMTATVLDPKVELRTRAFTHYGYGFCLGALGATATFGHTGGAPGINGQLDVYPEQGYIVVVLSNYDPPAAGDIAGKARELIAG
jgi:CubicO group peptidase (beta-lactamase class C family)